MARSTSRTGGPGRVFSAVKGRLDATGDRALPDRFSANWRSPNANDPLDEQARRRLSRDRREIIPWHSTRPLAGQRLLEIGCGDGASTVALCEQGAAVTGIDVSSERIELAERTCAAYGVEATLRVANGEELASRFAPGQFDWIIYWAVLEHMTISERLASLRQAWDLLPAGGLLTVIEAPNRLWLIDSHTSKLPFFMWLPDDLAFRVSGLSPRAGFGDAYGELTEEAMLDFQRRGRGVSFHEFVAAGIADPAGLPVFSCLQVQRRAANPVRAAGWRVSRHGRYEASLRAVAPEVDRGFFQPFLYLTLQK